MKSILLIGLGRFGRHIAEKLYELNHQILAIDKQEGTAPILNFYSLWELEILMCVSWRSAGIFKALWKQRPI